MQQCLVEKLEDLFVPFVRDAKERQRASVAHLRHSSWFFWEFSWCWVRRRNQIKPASSFKWKKSNLQKQILCLKPKVTLWEVSLIGFLVSGHLWLRLRIYRLHKAFMTKLVLCASEALLLRLFDIWTEPFFFPLCFIFILIWAKCLPLGQANFLLVQKKNI